MYCLFGFLNGVLLFVNDFVNAAMSEGACLQSQPCVLVESEHEVHVLHCLSAGALQQVVYHGADDELVAVLLPSQLTTKNNFPDAGSAGNRHHPSMVKSFVTDTCRPNVPL